MTNPAAQQQSSQVALTLQILEAVLSSIADNSCDQREEKVENLNLAQNNETKC